MASSSFSITLTEDELREIHECLHSGFPLPEDYRLRLFAELEEPLLLWRGKSRACRTDQFPLRLCERFAGDSGEGAASQGESGDWQNLLVRADNGPLLSSLLHGPLRQLIEAQGGIKLMYIDPPFAANADFTMPVDGSGQKSLRALAYRDRWEQGLHGFLCMIHERLLLMRELLADDGSLYLHCDWRIAPHLRLVLHEVFGAKHFLGDIVWHYTGGGRSTRYFSRKHDRLLHYAASERCFFNADAVRLPYKPGSGYARSGITSAAGKRYQPNPLGTPPDDVWDIPMVNPLARERLDYPTQKPEALLERVIKASSRPGDLVADFFCGSGGFPLVAETLDRKWLAVDSGALAVHCTRKRLLERRAAASPERRSRTFCLAELAPLAGAEHAGERAAGSLAPLVLRFPESGLVPGREGGEGLRCEARYDGSFFHSAPLPSCSPAYGLNSFCLSARFFADGFFLELKGFSIQGRDAQGAVSPAFLVFLAKDWQCWLDYWSIGCAGIETPAGAGMEKDIYANTIIWHSGRMRKDGRAALCSGFLSLPACGAESGGACDLVVSVVDVFANTSRLPLRLLPDASICRNSAGL